jgi:hypothetical protein
MEIKTKSNVLITIVPEGSSKILLFDKPVRALELGRAESSKLVTLLTENNETHKKCESGL